MFSKEEIEALMILSNQSRLFNFAATCFLKNSSEAFVSLCSMLTLSTSKREQLESRKTFFANLNVSKNQVRNSSKSLTYKNPKESLRTNNIISIKLNYYQVALGLKKNSKRWSYFSIDDLLSISMMIDLNRNGHITWDDFCVFTNKVDDYLNKNKSNPRESFLSLYHSIRQALEKNISTLLEKTENFKNIQQKLKKFGEKLSLKGFSPLFLLFNFLKEQTKDFKMIEERQSNDEKKMIFCASFVDFLENLETTYEASLHSNFSLDKLAISSIGVTQGKSDQNTPKVVKKKEEKLYLTPSRTLFSFGDMSFSRSNDEITFGGDDDSSLTNEGRIFTGFLARQYFFILFLFSQIMLIH
jgi:hypothetical protein